MPHLVDLAVVPAAGSGQRLGLGVPKAWVRLGDEPLVVRAVRQLQESGTCRRIVVVAEPPDPAWRSPETWADAGLPSVEFIVEGGATRHESVRRGLDAGRPVPSGLVLIHDAARPLVTTRDIARVVEQAAISGAAVGGWPVSDTVKRVDSGSRIVESVDRTGLFAVATPQVFRAEILQRALDHAGDDARQATDEASLVQDLGVAVDAVTVSRMAFKITHEDDLAHAGRLLAVTGPGE